MDPTPAAAPGLLIADRYRLEAEVSRGSQGTLWRASDRLAGEAPMALRELGPDQDQARWRSLWSRLQGVLHPQVPRFGEAIVRGEALWLVSEWQSGPTFQDLLEARRERQLVFGPGEVLLLLRQLLPVLAVLHGQELVHGDLTPANLLRRDRDGLPVLLDFGLAGPATGSDAAIGATPGYAPPELGRGAALEPWMDLYSLGVVALVLLSGEEPAALLDPVTLAWRWPAGLSLDPSFRAALDRLLAPEPAGRFGSAAQALAAFQELPMPENTGPVARADRTVVLVPSSPPPPPVGPDADEAEPEPESEPSPAPTIPSVQVPVPPPVPLRSRQQVKEEAVEGRLWPVVVALVLSAVVGISLGWWLLGRGKAPAANDGADTQLKLPASLPPAEVDQRQQLLNRLRALQVDRAWFLKVVDANLLAQFPEREGRLPTDALEDAPFRKVWNELAEEWLSRVEQLPIGIRRKLGSYSSSDWEGQQRRLVAQGLSPSVLRQLVSGNTQSLLPGRSSQDIPPEPFRQLWYAAAEQTLQSLRIESIQAATGQARVLSAELDASGARLFSIKVPAGNQIVLGVNGSPLMQMSIYDAEGALLEPKGPLRVVSLGVVRGSQVQLLISNDGVAPALITLSLRADPPPAKPVAPVTTPETPAGSPSEPPSPDAEPATPQESPPAPNPPPPAPGPTPSQ